MTTKTTITLSPIRRPYTSPKLKKRRMSSILTNRRHQTNFSLLIPTTITVSCEKQNLPDLVHDCLVEQQRRETITNIAAMLRRVGDQMDERLQVTKFAQENQFLIFHLFRLIIHHLHLRIIYSANEPTHFSIV